MNIIQHKIFDKKHLKSFLISALYIYIANYTLNGVVIVRNVVMFV